MSKWQIFYWCINSIPDFLKNILNRSKNKIDNNYLEQVTKNKFYTKFHQNFLYIKCINANYYLDNILQLSN